MTAEPPDENMCKGRKEAFDALVVEARACTLCPDLAGKVPVLSHLNGALSPKVFFIGEAPGRYGADRTRRPFYGDQSGANFQKLLESIGLKRDEIFITSAVMCSPRSATDANRKPTRREIGNCSTFLRQQLELLDPQIVATLGAVALDAIKAVEPHALTLKEHAGIPHHWNNRTLLPLYHPSPQVIAAQRGLDLQLKHFQGLASLLGDQLAFAA